MKKPSVKTHTKVEAIIPAFNNAREEAEWWDAIPITSWTKKHGKLV